MRFVFCDFNDVCNYASHNEKWFRLSTTTSLPMTAVSRAGVKMTPFISRCTFCEVPANVIAVQSRDVPMCPRGSRGLWNGYRFVMVSQSVSPLGLKPI